MERFPPRKILVPFDCSERAQRAWRHAELLARRFGSAVEAVYVAPYYVGPEVVQLEPLDAAARLRLKNCVAEKVPRAGAVHVREGDVVLGIVECARRCGADLIVMATAGLTGIGRLRRESITEGVVRSSPVPVYCARGEPRLPRSVLAPVNLEPYSLGGLWLAAEAARAMGARLVALHAADAAAAGSPALLRARDAVGSLGAELKVVRGRPIPVMLAESRDHGLVVLVVHRRGLLRDALLGTTAERFLRRSPVSVLTAPPLLPARRASEGQRRTSRWARLPPRRAVGGPSDRSAAPTGPARRR